MPPKRSILIFLIISSALISCRVNKPVKSATAANGSAESYTEKYKDLAISEMKRTGIPASITLAQGMIESDYGRSRLATEGNNHFGIKCHNDWTGPTIKHHDDRRNECFRKYRKPEESFYDHSKFLSSTSRYGFLFSLGKTDYKAWAKGLKKAGYATNPDYANMLIAKIEENELWRYDIGKQVSVTKPEPADKEDIDSGIEPPKLTSTEAENKNSDSFAVAESVSRVKENNRIQYIVVNDSDTRESIEKAFSLLKWELPKYNELKSDFELIPGQLLYLQPKRDKAEPGKEIHRIMEGETMFLISQKYGIKLKRLYEMNSMSEGEEPAAGDKIWLRSNKPVN